MSDTSRAFRSEPGASSITSFRQRLRRILQTEASTRQPRNVVILAIDGLPYELGKSAWPTAETIPLESVFPTTSSASWLSIMTGLSVESHGVPGVVFNVEGEAAQINFLTYQGPLLPYIPLNVFSDGSLFGYVPVSILGDLGAFPSSWRDLLTAHSLSYGAQRYFMAEGDGDQLAPATICQRIMSDVTGAITSHRGEHPCLVWCFIDLDHYIHRSGYDDYVLEFLDCVGQLADRLVEKDTVVLVNSDHGLTPTVHQPSIQQTLEDFAAESGGSLGGAGRSRWLSVATVGVGDDALAALAERLPETIRILAADVCFQPGSLARKRVGDWVLVADGAEFITLPGYRYDHGSVTAAERLTPFSAWGVCLPDLADPGKSEDE